MKRRAWLYLPAMAMLIASVALGLWQLSGGPRTYPWPSLLATGSTVTLLIWHRLIARDVRRRRALLDTHRLFNLQAGLPIDDDRRGHP